MRDILNLDAKFIGKLWICWIRRKHVPATRYRWVDSTGPKDVEVGEAYRVCSWCGRRLR